MISVGCRFSHEGWALDLISVWNAKTKPGNETHAGAPVPGVVSMVAVAAGPSVKVGDVLLSIEAMKMETVLHADRDGAVAEVLVCAGD